MFLASKLRLLILREPLLRPSQLSPFQLFIQEARTNLRFDIYLFLLLLMICFGIVLIFFRSPRDRSSTLLYIVGFLLIFCSYNLQKVIEANRTLNKSVVQPNTTKNTWSWASWMSSWRARLTNPFGIGHKSYLLSNTNLPSLERKGGTVPYLVSYKILPESEKGKSTEVNPSIGGSGLKKGNSLATLKREDQGVRLEESTFKEGKYLEGRPSNSVLQEHYIPKNPKSLTISRRDGNTGEKEVLLGNLMKIFQFKAETDENLQKHLLNFRSIEAQVSKILEEFSKIFKPFMKEAEKIEGEMVEFNASTRYLNISVNELKTEIGKWFFDLPKFKASREVPNYLSTLARNYQNSEGIENGDMSPIIRYENFMMFLLVVEMILSLLLFLSVLAKLEIAAYILKPVVSVGLIVVTLLSVIFLLNGQMLDRTCKSGAIKGCSFTPTLIDGVKRLQIVSKADDLEGQLGVILKESEYITEVLRLYVRTMIDTRVNAKISVFSNLFNKILFVYDDFDNLTKRKVDKSTFYNYIKMMSRLLENIASLLELSERKDMVDIYANEKAFLFWLNAEKGAVVESIREITEAGPADRSGMPPKWCSNALESICDARNGVDTLFLLTMLGGPAFLVLLYL
ncbi:hypothetical protein EROM_031300 [Encephalitozoon romaleae SJ-2008]|uniref:Uncharacterized protein n=1 Tax=Encephalitozoon romaleae (strain SJ-2008) TaxID=1178016 RepID=I7AQZ5_ENCRO|nr:hypothetical protein EROM_031300 [Encephalitozoon romaleae SJ-2008]AFN82752.1 hypothetical protein EROM_031300 [Encephalitozoon romaleae SJ-2008]